MQELTAEDLKVKKDNLLKIHPTLVKIIDGRNIRGSLNVKWVKELKESIKANGQRDPIIVNKNGEIYEVIDGHHRATALIELYEEGETFLVKAIKEEAYTSDAQRVINQLIVNDKLPLSPMATAEGIRRLLHCGLEIKEIAQKIAKSTTYVSQYNSLNGTPRGFQSLLELGVITPTLAFKIINEEQVDSFMEKYNAGEFKTTTEDSEQLTIESPEGEEESPKVTGKSVRITAKSLDSNKINSYKSFKKFASAPNFMPDRIPSEKRPIYDFMLKVLNNEVNELDFFKFFNED